MVPAGVFGAVIIALSYLSYGRCFYSRSFLSEAKGVEVGSFIM
jgi:hypothetical protein